MFASFPSLTFGGLVAGILGFTIPAFAADAPGEQATYRVVIGSTAGTGVAIELPAAGKNAPRIKATDAGWLLTSTAVLAACPKDEYCRISVEDAERNIFLTASIAETDEKLGIAILQTQTPLPGAVPLAAAAPARRASVHACAFDGNQRSCEYGTAVGTESAALQPGARRTSVLVTTAANRVNGMPVFTAAGTVAGVLVGTMSSGRNVGASVAVPAAAANALLRRATADYERRMNAKPKC